MVNDLLPLISPISAKETRPPLSSSACSTAVAPSPVAWRIHQATQKGSWMDPTVELLQALAPAVPKDMSVIVLCDRGIASPKLWQQIRDQGWHPCMRYRKNITFCAEGGRRLPAQRFVTRPDTAWVGRGTAFSLTDLAPNKVGPSWYALRFRIELGFKAIKSLGWKWDRTRHASPGTGWYCRWLHCWPWLRHQGGRRPRPSHRPRQPADTAHVARSPASQQLAEAEAEGQRIPARHRLAAPVDAQGPPLEPGLAAARTLAQPQVQLVNHLPLAPLKTLYIPLSGPPDRGM